MRVAFFGLPLAALCLHADGIEVAIAALCRPGAPGTRRLTRILGDDRVAGVAEALDAGFAARVGALAPDLIVSWFWTKQLSPSILAIPPLGSVGVHPSLLPRHRGPDPYFWAIEAGDAETGVTAHRLEEAYDTGAILGARRLSIDPAWNAWTLAKRLDRPSLGLLREVVGAFGRGDPPRDVPQREDLATHAPAPDEAILELDWHDPAAALVRRIRAASPWPGAFTRIGERTVTLTRAREASVFPRALAPGEAAVGADGVAVIRAGEGAVALLDGRDDDDLPLDASALADVVRRAPPE